MSELAITEKELYTALKLMPKDKDPDAFLLNSINISSPC